MGMTLVRVHQHSPLFCSRTTTAQRSMFREVLLTCSSLACTTSVLAYTSFLEYFSLDASRIGAMGSAYYSGAVVGMASNWYLPNKYGRVRTIQIGCCVSLLGASMQTGASSYALFVAGRVIGGFASGLIFVVCPAYASEISPPMLRGRIGGFYSYAMFPVLIIRFVHD